MNKNKSIELEIYKTVDLIKRIDIQRICHWEKVLEKKTSDEVFKELYSVFVNESRPETRFLDQQYAGKLLWTIKPHITDDPYLLVKNTLKNYDLSIEELPWYFAEIFGKNIIINILKKLKNEDLLEIEKQSINTFLFWLKASTIQQEQPEKSIESST